jgi:hypothetical protein
VASFVVTDNRGRRVPLPNGTAGPPNGFSRISTRRVTEADQQGFSSRGLPFGTPDVNAAVTHARAQKLTHASRMRRTGAYGGGTASMQLATSRPRDPMWYWKQNNIPFDFTEPEELAKIREFCTTPDTPVTMADNSSKPIGTVAVGESVYGWTYRLHVNGGLERNWVASKVIAVGVKQAPVVTVTLASGATVTCTADHRWANPNFTKLQRTERIGPWVQADSATEYQSAQVGTALLAASNCRVEHNARGYGYPAADTFEDKVISVEPVLDEDGVLVYTDVVSLQTLTGNYIAGGYCSKNCRLLYVTHPIVSACIDVYSKLPMQGMAFTCKDPQLVDFYTDLFFDQLNYEDFLLDLGTEYWLSGESWGLGGWNDTLGVWESDALINPDDVEVENSLFQPEPRYLMRLPESLRKILTTRTPHWQYTQLVTKWPELANYASEDALMPVSNYILKQLRFKADRFSNRGIPILMRGFRTLIQEEMLNSALDSIADRLYTPLILTKLGATAQDLGTNVPWIPTQDEMEDFNAVLDAALAADFRALTYHWAVDMQPVFGRENVPDLSNDFDRIVERILMVFGLSQTMLTGAEAGETYAADALNRDVVTQLLSHYQKMISRYVHDRAAIVAEAQEHYDYEVRQGRRYLVTEEIYEVDEETGEERIVEQPKLLVPDLEFKTLNISDEEDERQFVETLAAAGVPVPYRARLTTTGIDFDEAIEERSQEDVALAVAEQETRKKTFQALQRAGLPIAADLAQDFSPKAIQPGNEPALGMDGQDALLNPLGLAPTDLPALAPTQDDLDQDTGIEDTNAPPSDQGDGYGPGGEGDYPGRPEESDEERDGMPTSNQRAASLASGSPDTKPPITKISGYQIGQRFGIRQAVAEHYVAPDNSEEENARDFRPTGRFGAPRVLGMRQYLNLGGVPTRVAKRPRGEEDADG